MWIFAKQGFVSIVEHRQNTRTLLVRARVLEDLQYFREMISRQSDTPLEEIIETPDGDYLYRMKAPRHLVAGAIKVMVELIDYDNFKASVEDRTPERSRAYTECWVACALLTKNELT